MLLKILLSCFILMPNDYVCVIVSQYLSAFQSNNMLLCMRNLINFNFQLEVLLETKVKSKLQTFPLDFAFIVKVSRLYTLTNFISCKVQCLNQASISGKFLLKTWNGVDYTTQLNAVNDFATQVHFVLKKFVASSFWYLWNYLSGSLGLQISGLVTSKTHTFVWLE